MTTADKPDLFAFEVRVRWLDKGSIVNERTAGRAKASVFGDLDEYCKFTDLRVRKLGPPHTSAAFLRTAKYRGMPDLRCGDEVNVCGRRGLVVGHNDSANFDVLFHEGDWAGCVLNVHPGDFGATDHDH